MRTLLFAAVLTLTSTASAQSLAQELTVTDAPSCEVQLDSLYLDIDDAYAEWAYLTSGRQPMSSTATQDHASCADELNVASVEFNVAHDDVHFDGAEFDARDNGPVPEGLSCARYCSVDGCGVCVEWTGGKGNDVMTEEIVMVIEAL